MSEHLSSPETHDPSFAEAVKNVAVSATKILEHYKNFAHDQQLELPVYIDRDKGYLEPSDDQRLNISQLIDLTDDPAATETRTYHIIITSHRDQPPHLSHTRTEAEISVPFGQPENAQAAVKKGSIHTIDNALHNFIETKGL